MKYFYFLLCFLLSFGAFAQNKPQSTKRCCLPVLNKDGKPLVDKYGKPILECKTVLQNPIFPYRSCDKWGFVNQNKTIVIPIIFDSVGFFQNELAFVKIGEKYGYINPKGEIAIPVEYDSAKEFFGGYGYISYRGESFYINQSGERCKISNLDFNDKKKSVLAYMSRTKCTPYTLNNKMGWISVYNIGCGATKIDSFPAIYEKVISNHELIYAQKANKWGIFHANNQAISDFIYDEIVLPEDAIENSPQLIVARQENLYTFLNTKGEILHKAQYEYATNFNWDGFAYVKPLGRQGGFIDMNGNEFFEESGIGRCDEFYTKKTTASSHLLNLKVSPNPIQKAANLSCFLNKSTNLSLTITDILGKIVYEKQYTFQTKGEQNYELEMEGFSKGMYILNVKTEDGNQSVMIEKQ